MKFDLKRIRENVRTASTEDLLDRATLWREGMEPAALELIELELQRRGIPPAEIDARGKRRLDTVHFTSDGLPAVCYRCHKAAVERCWVWGRFLRLVPLFPRRAYVCEEHRPGRVTSR